MRYMQQCLGDQPVSRHICELAPYCDEVICKSSSSASCICKLCLADWHFASILGIAKTHSQNIDPAALFLTTRNEAGKPSSRTPQIWRSGPAEVSQ